MENKKNLAAADISALSLYHKTFTTKLILVSQLNNTR